MKWIYGKQDWNTIERGMENCYLMTNGLGGFSSMTMTGGVSRNDHALLMACVKAPNHRYNLVHRLREALLSEGEEQVLSVQEFADGHTENGLRYLSTFTYEDTPVWTYHADGVEIIKEAGLKQGENTAALCYEIRNRSERECRFAVTPFYQFVPKGKDLEEDAVIDARLHSSGGEITSGALTLSVRTNGCIKEIPSVRETYYYRYDACDGRRETGTAWTNHRIETAVRPGESRMLEIVYEMTPSADTAHHIIEGVKEYRKELERRAGYQDTIAGVLSKSAAQFVSARESTGGSTILAGYPFFEDWGRDTMIALPGICLSTGRYDTARQILKTFARYEKDGLMPNLFPEGGSRPLYNTADAALLFINCVYLYYERTKDPEFVREVWPVMERIVEGYRYGTHYGIKMDEDGLIQAGEGLDQVTWMDVRIGEILPTPRHGKPVEINAYWYNALRVMETLSGLCGAGKEEYALIADRVKRKFTELFWIEKEGRLKDLISGTAADMQMRCNQIWAVSMPFTMLDGEKEKRIVEAVFARLYTPYGLRTLEEKDGEFHAFYQGSMEERDMAYHQGTVWVFPLGAYYLAYLKVHDYSKEARQIVTGQLEGLWAALREGCIGQLPEIYDGGNPAASKGCFAQAWSVGELLRVYERLERD